MLLPIDTYYQASETEARLDRQRPHWPRVERRSTARRTGYGARNAIGHALIGLGRIISVEPTGVMSEMPR